MDKQKEEILDYFGKCVIEEVYDAALYSAGRTVDYTTKNKIDLKHYSEFKTLSDKQREKVHELLKETTVDIIYRFLEMIEEHDEEFKIIVEKDNVTYSLTDISEKMGSEMAAVDDEEGWIKKFSKI